MIPANIQKNHDRIISKLNATKDITQSERDRYTHMLNNSLNSTNGRTQNEKIKDIAETSTSSLQILIDQNLDRIKIEQKQDSLIRDVSDIKEKISGIVDAVEYLINEHGCGGKFDFESKIKEVENKFAPRTPFDKFIYMVSHLPWSATFLGLGICVLLGFKPEIIQFLKFIF